MGKKRRNALLTVCNTDVPARQEGEVIGRPGPRRCPGGNRRRESGEKNTKVSEGLESKREEGKSSWGGGVGGLVLPVKE